MTFSCIYLDVSFLALSVQAEDITPLYSNMSGQTRVFPTAKLRKVFDILTNQRGDVTTQLYKMADF